MEAVMLLWMWLACDGAQDPKETGSEGTVEKTDSEGNDTSVDTTDVTTKAPLECPLPPECIDPSEAVDRGLASIYMAEGASIIFEDKGANICMDRWYTLLGPGTQDAIAGFKDIQRMTPGHDYELLYGNDIFGYPADENAGGWWCIEHNQYTQPQQDFDFIGAQAPPSLYEIVHDRADLDGDGVEDHAGFLDGQYQVQWTVWAKIADEPVDIIGRRPNYFALRAGESARETIEATDLGRKFSYGSIQETVPAGLIASDFSVAPARTVNNADGSVTYWWAAKLQPAVDGASEYEPSIYYPAKISYTVTMQACVGRVVGPPPSVTWQESSGKEWTSYGSELTVECCPG